MSGLLDSGDIYLLGQRVEPACAGCQRELEYQRAVADELRRQLEAAHRQLAEVRRREAAGQVIEAERIGPDIRVRIRPEDIPG